MPVLGFAQIDADAPQAGALAFAGGAHPEMAAPTAADSSPGRAELSAGMTALNTMVILAHIERIKAGDFQAIKWWEQARMQWRRTERVTVVDSGAEMDPAMLSDAEIETPPQHARGRALSNRRACNGPVSRRSRAS